MSDWHDDTVAFTRAELDELANQLDEAPPPHPQPFIPPPLQTAPEPKGVTNA